MTTIKIETILTEKGGRVFTTTANVSIAAAVKTLSANNIGALIVLDSTGHPMGILSERDVIRALALESDVLRKTVGDLMTTPVTVGSPRDDVESVLQTMTARRFRHMPIVENGELVGMCTLGDLVKGQLKQYRGTVATLETQLMSTP
jgi:CBS domain-containing protein